MGSLHRAGGAIAVDTAAPAFIGCRFESNLATEGGGALYAFDGSPTLTQCDLIDYITVGEAIGVCRGDLNADTKVDGADLTMLLGAWGVCP